MMQPEIQTFLEDVNQAANDLTRFIADRDYDSYANDSMLVAAVERKFEIIGEALNQAARIEPTLPQYISEFRRIIDFRNVIAHGYATVSTEAVWYILIEKLPVLHREVQGLLQQHD